MAVEHCLGSVCFFHLDPAAPKIFGFAELLAGLALIVVAWTIADFRFKFRIATAPIPVVRISSITVMSVSVLALLTDLWRAEGWLVPSGWLLSPSSWQFFLALLFLLSFFTWVWYAVISPPALTARTSKKIESQLLEAVSNGSPQELAIVADEVRRYARTLATEATDYNRAYFARTPEDRPKPNVLEESANNIYAILADRRMCRVIIRSSPGAAVDIFSAIRWSWRYNVPARSLGLNLLEEGIADRESVLYFESAGLAAGYMAFERSLIRTMFSDYSMLCGQLHLLKVDIEKAENWSSTELQIYTRVVLTAYTGFTMMQLGERPAEFAHSFGIIGSSVRSLGHIPADESILKHQSIATLAVVMQFIESGVRLLRSQPDGNLRYVRRRRGSIANPDLLDDWVTIIVVQILEVAALRRDHWSNFEVMQMVNQRTFTSQTFTTRAGKVILHRVRRRLVDMLHVQAGIAGVRVANVLRFCLTSVAHDSSGKYHSPQSRPLFLAVKGWLASNFLAWYAIAPDLANSALPEGCEFDQAKSKIILNDFGWVGAENSTDHIIDLR